ncbi:DUF1542 domain-containing protein, partial [Streptococcus pseudopneumoniae]|uniref:DUF1542 domain-containing protein n=1 Tax=Streptococcus pseudopneumoniae TaxID=257758 RepID=UPI001419A7E3
EGQKQAIVDKASEKTTAIGNNPDLTEAEKKTAKAKVTEEAEKAKTAIDRAGDQRAVNQAKQDGLTALDGLNPIGREGQKQAIVDKASEKTTAIGNNPDLTEAEKKTAKAKVTEEAEKAKTAIDQAGDQEAVNQAKQDGLTALDGLNPIGRDGQKQAIVDKANEKTTAIGNNPDLTEAEKKTAKAKVTEEAEKAKTAIDQAGDQEAVNQAKEDGLTALDKILKDLSDRINQGNSFTPSNGGNQTGSDNRGDTASQGDRPAPSGDGSQGDANNQTQPTTPSTPAHLGDSTDQATSLSSQQRGTGNATEAESPQGLSESSARPAVRSRRSVAFAGGAQSSQEKQVDKSVLRELIQDLETRLKDLDGIDQSVIDAAKIILGEGQEALRNADLSEAGLREITAKVKEALESLRGKQATKDEEKTKETRKEQGHLPYGTMIGSLLALLGLLLFLIARRKKESELKKLTKELTKVLQESDLTSVDAKVLDQAREALAQAVAFLANEKESDHTEDELIEKLKAILAQLR